MMITYKTAASQRIFSVELADNELEGELDHDPTVTKSRNSRFVNSELHSAART